MAQVVEAYRHMLLNTGEANIKGLLSSFALSIFLVLIGLVIFNKTEKTFIDTV